jgi:hypothetical protein
MHSACHRPRLTSIILVVLVIYWLLLMVYTIPSLISGELLLAEAKAEMDKEKKQEEEGGKQTRHENAQGEAGGDQNARTRSRTSDATRV